MKQAIMFLFTLFVLAFASAAQADDSITFGGVAFGIRSGTPVLVSAKEDSEPALRTTLLDKCSKEQQAKSCRVLKPIVDTSEKGEFAIAAIAAKKNGKWRPVIGLTPEIAKENCIRHGEGECHPEFSTSVEEDGFR